MGMRVKFRNPDEGDAEGHGASFRHREVEVEKMRLETAVGVEITLEPAEGEEWKVTSGPDDLQGHGMRWSDRRLKAAIRPLGGALARLR
jgi:hypothetical protein